MENVSVFKENSRQKKQDKKYFVAIATPHNTRLKQFADSVELPFLIVYS